MKTGEVAGKRTGSRTRTRPRTRGNYLRNQCKNFGIRLLFRPYKQSQTF